MKNTANDNVEASGDSAGSFAELGVSPFFIEKLGRRNIVKPTMIQNKVIPLLAAGEPVIFRSATGTGKTFAYLLPLLRRLLAGDTAAEGGVTGPRGGPLMLICAPTFELCSQIKTEADFLLAGIAAAVSATSQGAASPTAGDTAVAGAASPATGDTAAAEAASPTTGAAASQGAASPAAGVCRPPASLKISLLIGSVSVNRQIETLKKEKPAIVVGNPGRLLALARMGRLKLRGVKILVLDEGDRLAADELREETGELVRLLPRKGCLVTACSATLSPKSREQLLGLFGECGSPGPRIIETDEQEILRDRIEHWAIFSEGRRKIQSLRSLLAAVQPKKALIFSGGSGQPGNIVSQLQHHHISAAGLYGDMDKKKRKEAIDAFRAGKIAALVSSDLAARGLDIPGITHVIALDVPAEGGPYIHRAGRTGRAGKRGVMITIGDGEEMRRLSRLEKKLGIVIHPKELYRGKVGDIMPQAERSAPGQSGYRPS